MGVVYRAHDQRLRRDVALKLLPAGVAGQEERRARLLAEARAASALNHPGITTIYEVGEDGEQLFIVMELVSGQTLRAAIAEGAVETPALARLGAQVAEALSAAHAHGVVHGDVKPENIIVQPDGRVKLLDFGIARQLAAETLAITRQETVPVDPNIVGTLAYMAPEQLRGTEPDARTDLFSPATSPRRPTRRSESRRRPSPCSGRRAGSACRTTPPSATTLFSSPCTTNRSFCA